MYRKIVSSFTQAEISILFPMLIHRLADTEKFTFTYLLYIDHCTAWLKLPKYFLADPPLTLTHLLLEWVNTYSFAAYITLNEVKDEDEH